jgi:hypothetical protein
MKMNYKLIVIISIVLMVIVLVMIKTNESFNNIDYNDGVNRKIKRKRSCGNYHVKSYISV